MSRVSKLGNIIYGKAGAAEFSAVAQEILLWNELRRACGEVRLLCERGFYFDVGRGFGFLGRERGDDERGGRVCVRLWMPVSVVVRDFW